MEEQILQNKLIMSNINVSLWSHKYIKFCFIKELKNKLDETLYNIVINLLKTELEIWSHNEELKPRVEEMFVCYITTEGIKKLKGLVYPEYLTKYNYVFDTNMPCIISYILPNKLYAYKRLSKQFIENSYCDTILRELNLLQHTIHRLEKRTKKICIVLVVSNDAVDFWKQYFKNNHNINTKQEYINFCYDISFYNRDTLDNVATKLFYF
jgi:hypothetical protein